MKLTSPSSASSDFRRTSTLGVAIAGLLVLPPFSVNNFLQGRNLLGFGSLAIVAILGWNAWSISRRRFYPWLNFLGLVPAIIFFLVLALRTQGVIGALWCYPALISFYFMLSERQAWTANAALLAAMIPQAWFSLAPPLATRVAATLLAVSGFSIIFIRVITVQQKKLETLATTDPLTGVNNRMTLRARIEKAIDQNYRLGIPMSLVALDLDYFKEINDTFGHEVGDRVLIQFGELLLSRLRRHDVVFRLGGEEFVILLWNTNGENASNLAEELRRRTESEIRLPERAVTVSIGTAMLEPTDDWTTWMKRADANLYRAKEEGRNRVVTS